MKARKTVLLAVCTVGLTAWAGAQSASVAACNGPSGARFNLEPRAKAVAQQEPVADFLLNRVAPGDDLVVQVANDWRGNITGVRWDGSVSGYYVHRSTTADCSVQFEGGLPAISSGGSNFVGIGNTVVAADPARDVFFAADSRLGPSSLAGSIGLFRVSASTLLNPVACPEGTHNAAQSASCWGGTSAVILTSAAFQADPALAVDERPTKAGVGAGDVYVSALGSNGSAAAILLTACTNTTLKCSPTVAITPTTSPGFDYVSIREDGLITISWANANADGSNDIVFVTCTPAGAPKVPICSAPMPVVHVANPISSSFNSLFPLQNVHLLTFTYPKHASREETAGKFTTFLAYDDCEVLYQAKAAPTCLESEVMLVSSTDSGKTWSRPVSVDSAPGHHFMPAIYTDTSKGIVNLAYYSSQGDRFNHRMQIFRNQIPPGSVTPDKPVAVTTVLDEIDPAPQEDNQSQFDYYMGIVARGPSATGRSHLYTSFDSTSTTGTYEGKPLPELNNNISMTTY